MTDASVSPGVGPTPAKSAAPRRRWRRRLALVSLAMLLTVLAAEAALWLFDLYPPSPNAWPGEFENRPHANFECDPLVGWRMKPDAEFTLHAEGIDVTYAADAKGHRQAPRDRRRTSAPHTVVLAGDSFFWGAEVQYDDSLAALLERHYAAVRVENLAQPGFGLDQVWQSVVHQGLPLRPALVIVGIYPQDLSRSHTAFREDMGFNKPTFRLESGRLVPSTSADRPSALLSLLEHHSRVFGLWGRAMRNVGFRHGVGSWWSLNEAILDDLRRAVDAAGCRILFVHVPLHDWRPFGALAAYAERHGVALVDPVRLDPERPAGLIFEPAGHFTPRGVRYLADRIIGWIDRAGPPLGR